MKKQAMNFDAHLDRPAFSPTGSCVRVWGNEFPDEHRCDRAAHGPDRHRCACSAELA